MHPTVEASSRRRALTAVGEAAVLAMLWLAYLTARHVLEGGRAESLRHADDVWALERALHLPSEAAVQSRAMGSDTLIRSVNAVYAYAHYPVVVVTLVVLYARHRSAYRWFRDVLVVTTFLALVLHVLYPLAPPRMRPDLGMIDTGRELGQSTYSADPGTGFANQYAAMPSMHVAWAVLVSLTIVLCLTTRWRWIAPAYAVVMLLVVVVSGNHYWLDGIVGTALLGVAVAVVGRRWPTADPPGP